MSQLQSEFQTNLLNKEKLENRYLLRIDLICLKLNYLHVQLSRHDKSVEKGKSYFIEAAYLRINN